MQHLVEFVFEEDRLDTLESLLLRLLHFMVDFYHFASLVSTSNISVAVKQQSRKVRSYNPNKSVPYKYYFRVFYQSLKWLLVEFVFLKRHPALIELFSQKPLCFFVRPGAYFKSFCVSWCLKTLWNVSGCILLTLEPAFFPAVLNFSTSCRIPCFCRRRYRLADFLNREDPLQTAIHFDDTLAALIRDSGSSFCNINPAISTGRFPTMSTPRFHTPSADIRLEKNSMIMILSRNDECRMTLWQQYSGLYSEHHVSASINRPIEIIRHANCVAGWAQCCNNGVLTAYGEPIIKNWALQEYPQFHWLFLFSFCISILTFNDYDLRISVI